MRSAGHDVGRQAVAAEARLALLEQLAAEAVHVRRRAADVGDRAAEVVVRGERRGLAQDRLLAAALDRAPLVERDRAERAVGHAAAVRVDRPAHRLERRRCRRPRRGRGATRAGRAGRSSESTSACDAGGERRVLHDDARAVAPARAAASSGVFSSRTAWKSSISGSRSARELLERGHDARARGHVARAHELARARACRAGDSPRVEPLARSRAPGARPSPTRAGRPWRRPGSSGASCPPSSRSTPAAAGPPRARRRSPARRGKWCRASAVYAIVARFGRPGVPPGR